jgi:aspartokinase/homoserine dehydrogenase 1
VRRLAANGVGPNVHKFGGSCLATPELTVRCARIAIEAASAPRGTLVVVSALKGQTNLIREMLDRLLAGKDGIDNFMEEVRARHEYIAQSTIMDRHIRSAVMERVETLATRLERLLYGVIYTEELTPRSRDQALTHGERMSAHIFAGVLADRGTTAIPLEADRAGVITDGVFGSATADIDATSLHLGNTVGEVLGHGDVPVLTGFFGSDVEGHTTTFGRNGSDYSAAVAARALGSPVLTLWKDVSGFMSADPAVVAKARLVPLISYEEAAELAYFGLDVLHPRTVEPLRPAGIPIQIRDIHNPEHAGSMISPRAETPDRTIKSITIAKGISILNVHSASIGIRPRLLARIISALAKADIQILGLSTSQASLGVVLRTKELEAAEDAIRSFHLPELERLESVSGFTLVGAVGAGALEDPSVVPRMMATLSDLGHGVATVASGPSAAAAYFVVDESVTQRAVELVHAEFCEDT